MKSLPELSHLQVLVLESLGTAKMRGRDLRAELLSRGEKKSGPAFYQLMARLEDSGFVKGEYSQKVVDGQIIKERSYRLTALGERALQSTYDFYSHLGRFKQVEGAAYA